MRVLVLTNMYPSAAKPVYGRFVRDQVEDLRALGVDVKVLAIAGDRSRLNYARAVSELRTTLRTRPRDLVHAHYGLAGAVALTQNQVPVVTTFHGSDTYIWWHRAVSWVVARRGMAIFVSRDRARALGLPHGTVIPCGVDTTRFAPIPSAAARRSLGWDESSPVILFPGNRNVALKRFDLFDHATSLARQTLPALRTVCLGDFDRDTIPLVMNAVDATLMTSESEGSPIAVRESLACQTPVVSVPVGDVPEVLEGLPGCAIAAREPSDLAQKLVDAVGAGKHPALRERAELTARTRVASRLVTLYEDVLGGPPPGATDQN
jgi:glycosyltransferase involved in cell wall biosynthesis